LASANRQDETQSTRQPIVLALLLAVATLAVYYPVRHLPFINYDDILYVTDNVHVQSGLDWDTVQWAFATNAASNWHPLSPGSRMRSTSNSLASIPPGRTLSIF
jgi:protein O-mannosyl-transferase